ncbi:hypothetical protein AWR38_14575 [Idiomarina sp. WRN-38]|nr:hypothetical protein AUR68_14560 [Idiomarina sp. H105]MBE92208.1 hypothetical protein [Idiomarina sp.]OAF04603.1 hypothetical protein AWR38_14575 [Idiomarina sp. WRN-38]
MRKTSFQTQMLSQAWKKNHLPSHFGFQRKEERPAVSEDRGSHRRTSSKIIDTAFQNCGYELKLK